MDMTGFRRMEISGGIIDDDDDDDDGMATYCRLQCSVGEKIVIWSFYFDELFH